MKGALQLVVLGLSLAALSLSVRAQEDVARATERQEQEERFKDLQARVKGLEDANVALQKKVGDLEGLVRNLKDQLGAEQGKAAMQEDLRRLADKLQEVDRKRQEDLKHVADEIARLGSTPPPSGNRKPPAEAGPGSSSDDLYPYVVQPGDTLSAILTAYNAEFKKQGKKGVSLQQVIDANPGIKPNNLQAGRKIYIPKPK